MKRAIILVLDSLGIGGAPDAEAFGDAGANTLGHIADACASGKLKRGPLRLPNLARLGLGRAAAGASGAIPIGLETDTITAAYGHAAEISKGKDTPSGHWEMAGVPVLFDWHYFPHTMPFLPAELADALIEQADLPGLLGNCHASGTQVLVDLGEQHLSTGKPIAYTSTDSVLQIAAHEETFGLQRLYALCELARSLLDEQGLNVGRVIARPFLGNDADNFKRTGNRRDYAVPPPAPTLLERLVANGKDVIAIGKVADIYAHRGISQSIKANGNDALFDATLAALGQAGDGSLIFANFVDFDMLYGHRRDGVGYAAALEAFDARLPELEQQLGTDDIVIISADHGNDTTWAGTDHTREQVPVLLYGPSIEPRDLGQRTTFADIGQSVASHLRLAPLDYGVSFI